jgi:hypothetical protein
VDGREGREGVQVVDVQEYSIHMKTADTTCSVLNQAKLKKFLSLGQRKNNEFCSKMLIKLEFFIKSGFLLILH